MKTVIRLIADVWCDKFSLEEIAAFAENLASTDVDCPTYVYDLLYYNKNILDNLLLLAEYKNKKDVFNSIDFQIEVTKILLDEMKLTLENSGNNTNLVGIIRFLNINLYRVEPCHWLDQLYNDTDMFGEYWDDIATLKRAIELRISDVESWLEIYKAG